MLKYFQIPPLIYLIWHFRGEVYGLNAVGWSFWSGLFDKHDINPRVSENFVIWSETGNAYYDKICSEPLLKLISLFIIVRWLCGWEPVSSCPLVVDYTPGPDLSSYIHVEKIKKWERKTWSTESQRETSLKCRNSKQFQILCHFSRGSLLFSYMMTIHLRIELQFPGVESRIYIIKGYWQYFWIQNEKWVW